MSAISTAEVARLADLARIHLEPDELQRLTADLGGIVDVVATVSEVATDDVPATSHPIAMTNVFRDDVVRDVLTAKEALAGAPASEQSRFRVPQILGEEA